MPLIPGILMSDRIRMSDCSPGYSREGPCGGLREIHGEPTRAEIARKLLVEK